MADEEEPSSSSAVEDRAFHKSVTKRFNAMTDRQDSIQALSMWIIHHKAQCQKICECWLTALRRSKMNRRLHLFYLANDVVQNCKKKNAKIFLLAFKNVLKDAIVLVRDDSIHEKIERILCIWEERNTYFTDFVNELRQLLNDRESVSALVSSTNYKPDEVIETISRVKMLESNVSVKHKKVLNLKIDASKVEAVKQLKDRSNSSEFAKQFDDSYNKMQTYVKVLENEIEQRGRLIEILEKGQTYYEVQSDDAMVVANAYRNFGLRINNLKKRLDTLKMTVADADEPLPSPSAEAPSPENSPEPVEGAEDMEMSDNEEINTSIIVSVDPALSQSTNSPQVTSSKTNSSNADSSLSGLSLNDRLAELGSQIPGVSGNDPRSQPHSYNPLDHRRTASPLNQSNTTTAKPLDYLSTLITKTNTIQQVKPGGSVLKNLTDFAEKVKNPPAQSWQDYKRKQEEKIKMELQRSQAEQAAMLVAENSKLSPAPEPELQVTPLSEEGTPVTQCDEISAENVSMSYPPEESVISQSSSQEIENVGAAIDSTAPVQVDEEVEAYDPTNPAVDYNPNSFAVESSSITEVSPTSTDHIPVSTLIDEVSPTKALDDQMPLSAEPVNHAPLQTQISLEDAPVKQLPPGVRPPGPPPGPPPTTIHIGAHVVDTSESVVAGYQSVSPDTSPQQVTATVTVQQPITSIQQSVAPIQQPVAPIQQPVAPIQQPANTAVRIVRPLTTPHPNYNISRYENTGMNSTHTPVRVTVNQRLTSPPRPPVVQLQRPGMQHMRAPGPPAGLPPRQGQSYSGYKRPATHLSMQQQQDALDLLDDMHATQHVQPIRQQYVQPHGQQLHGQQSVGHPVGQQPMGQPVGQPRYQPINNQQMYMPQQPMNKRPFSGYQQYGGNQYY